MSEKERLLELLLESEPIKERDLDDGWGDNEISDIAEYLLENDVIVLPCERVHFIVNKGTQFEYVDSMSIHCLKIYEAKNLAKYGFYTTKEEAERALRK